MYINKRRLYQELTRTISNPRRVLLLADRSKRLSLLRSLQLREHKPVVLPSDYRIAEWQQYNQKIQTRHYITYEDYIANQKLKLDLQMEQDSSVRLEYDREYRDKLRDRLLETRVLVPGMSVLCLAARLGAEVRAFLDCGCFAVGLDLNPGKENKYVVFGDFHELQFPDQCVDIVFTNSLDHVYDIDKVLCEIKRVLKPRGRLIVEATNGIQEGYALGHFESFIWHTVDDLVDYLESKSFNIVYRTALIDPWPGQHIHFENETAGL